MNAPSSPGPRTWLVVLATAGVTGAIGIAFVVGIVVGALVSRDGGAAASRSTSDTPLPPSRSGSGTPGGDAPGAAGSLDPCVVGTWRATEHSEDLRTDQGQARLTGLLRSMTFTADGTQTIVYQGTRATLTGQGGDLPAVFDGEVVYRTSTSGDTMSFELQSAEGTVTIDPDGAKRVEKLEPATGDVTYSCDRATLRQETAGYLSVYERTG